MNSNQKQNIQYFFTSNSIALRNCSERLFHMLNPKFQSDLFSANSRQQALIKFLCCVFVWKIERCCVFRLSCTQINTVIFQAKIWCRHNGHFQIQRRQCFNFLASVIREQTYWFTSVRWGWALHMYMKHNHIPTCSCERACPVQILWYLCETNNLLIRIQFCSRHRHLPESVSVSVTSSVDEVSTHSCLRIKVVAGNVSRTLPIFWSWLKRKLTYICTWCYHT